MVLKGPQKIKYASTKYWYGNKYPGSAMEVNVGIIHTTEGMALPGYGGGGSAPNVTGVPNFKTKKIDWFQHFDVDRSSRALVNKSGGVETNTLNAFQVELVGTCDPAHKTSWGNKKAGVDYIFWPTAPEWALKEVGWLVRWLYDNHGMKMQSTVTFKAYPASYGSNGVRLSGSQWQNYYGWLGHQHVPENDHGDPGNINISKIISYAKAWGSGEPATGDPVEKELEGMNKKDAFELFWEGDYAPAPSTASTVKTNPTWKPSSVIVGSYEQISRARDDVAALEKKVDALTALVKQLLAK